MSTKPTLISIKRLETLTQAYQAGVIVARVENVMPNENIPSIPQCMIYFHSLRELFGERLWQKLKASATFGTRIKVYEAMTYQTLLPSEMIGTYREFCLGYCRVYEHSKLKAKVDKNILKASKEIIEHVHSKVIL